MGKAQEAQLAFAALKRQRKAEAEEAEAKAKYYAGLDELERNNLLAARERFQAALVHKPDFGDAHARLGEVFFKLKDLGKAKEEFTAALKLKPDDDESRQNLAIVLARQGALDPAARELGRILAVHPDSAGASTRLSGGPQQPWPAHGGTG